MQSSIESPAGTVTVGTRIRIKHLNNGNSPINDSHYDGRKGTVTLIDDIGQLHGTWGGLAVIPEVDNFEIL